MIFRFPYPCAVGAAWVICDLDNVGDLVLYDSDGNTPLATVSLDPDVRASTAALQGFIRFPTDVALLANTNYRLALKPTSTLSLSLRESTVNAAAIMDSFE